MKVIFMFVMVQRWDEHEKMFLFEAFITVPMECGKICACFVQTLERSLFEHFAPFCFSEWGKCISFFFLAILVECVFLLPFKFLNILCTFPSFVCIWNDVISKNFGSFFLPISAPDSPDTVTTLIRHILAGGSLLLQPFWRSDEFEIWITNTFCVVFEQQLQCIFTNVPSLLLLKYRKQKFGLFVSSEQMALLFVKNYFVLCTKKSHSFQIPVCLKSNRSSSDRLRPTDVCICI